MSFFFRYPTISCHVRIRPGSWLKLALSPASSSLPLIFFLCKISLDRSFLLLLLRSPSSIASTAASNCSNSCSAAWYWMALSFVPWGRSSLFQDGFFGSVQTQPYHEATPFFSSCLLLPTTFHTHFFHRSFDACLYKVVQTSEYFVRYVPKRRHFCLTLLTLCRHKTVKWIWRMP